MPGCCWPCSWRWGCGLLESRLPEGIHFGLDESRYHAEPALSNSGIKNLLTSPMDFWARCSWLNPDYEDERSDAMQVGKAYHARVVEGPIVFKERYAPMLDPAAHTGALKSAADIKARLAEIGEKVSGNKDEIAKRLLAADPAAQIWDELVSGHADAHKGKELLPPDLIRKIEIAAAMIEKHPDLCKAFSGGHPEVSIIWTDKEHGVPMKARLDYLKIRVIVDLKTFSNPLGKPIDRAVAYEMASRKYHLQCAVYQEAVNAAKEMVFAKGRAAVHGNVPDEWIQAFSASEPHEFLFVFQQTGLAPVARGYRFPKHNTFDIGRITANQAKLRYAECFAAFGNEPWVDVTSVRDFDDTEFPAFMTDG